MIELLIEVPLVLGLLAFLLRWDGLRRFLLILTATTHLALTVWVWVIKPQPLMGSWFGVDSLGMIFLGITSLLFCSAAFYCVGYLQREGKQKEQDWGEDFLFRNTPEAVFTGCLLLFLATMTAVITSQHLGIMWVAMEATTLVSAPLIYFHRHRRSLEATWKYLLICSVGIALALLGNLFLAVAILHLKIPLLLPQMLALAKQVSGPWLKLAFIFLIIGYGTKMGLAPLHTWLPDAHSEAPSVVSALLSGALLNCAFLSVLRVHQVCVAAGLADFSQDIFRFFGFLSLLVAAIFILGQRDYKRMLAYSSIEHMGILALAVGLGNGAIFAMLLHTINHSFTKAGLFFTAGNILARYKTKTITRIQGVLRILPVSGVLWIMGFLAITGMPPFGIFVSKFLILKTAVDQGQYGVACGFLVLLAVVFVGMVQIFLPMAQGMPRPESQVKKEPEPLWSILPTVVLLGTVLILGIYLPHFLTDVLREAARSLETFL